MQTMRMTAALPILISLLGGSALGAECGGPLSLKCGADEWCSYAAPNQCGAQDRTGTCEKRPQACTMIFLPVCGCDGRDYSSQCQAHASGAGVSYAGACKKS